MSEEKDLDQIENGDAGNDEGFGNLEDFVEFDDLQNLEGLGDLSSLGDISDLGDLSDLADIASGPLDDLDVNGDIPLPVMDSQEEEEQPGEAAIVQDIPEETKAAEEFYIPDKEEIPEEPDIKEDIEENTASGVPEELTVPDLEVPDGNGEEETIQEDAPEEDSLGIIDDDAAGSDEEDITLDDIVLDAGEDIIPETEAVPEETVPEEMETVQEENIPEEPEAVQEEIVPEEDGSTMDSVPLDMEDSLGIDIMPGEEEMQDAIGIEEPDGTEDDGLDSMLDSLGVPEAVPVASAKDTEDKEEPPQEEAVKEKKPGFFKRVFGNVVTDEIAEAERKAKEEEEQQAVLKAEEEAKAKEEKEAKKAAAAEAKEAKKAEKAAKKAEKAEEKAAKKAEKAAKKEAEKEAEEQEVVGKLNKAGVIIVVAGAAVILAGVIAGTNVFGYNTSKSEAERYFSLQRYSEAYNEARGTKLEDKDPELYDKIVTVMKVQQSLDTYSTYSAMKYYPDALNALLRGLQKYDDNIDMAMDLEIEGDLKVCRNKILSILKEEFGLSKKEAYEILSLDAGAYTKRVVGIAKKKI